MQNFKRQNVVIIMGGAEREGGYGVEREGTTERRGRGTTEREGGLRRGREGGGLRCLLGFFGDGPSFREKCHEKCVKK